MNKKTIIIIVVVVIIFALILGGVIIYLIIRKKNKDKYNKLFGGANDVNINIGSDDKLKLDFLAKNKVLFITDTSKKYENSIIYDVIEILYGFISNLASDSSKAKYIKYICDTKENNNEIYVCGLSLTRFKKIYSSLNDSKQYNMYLEKFNI